MLKKYEVFRLSSGYDLFQYRLSLICTDNEIDGFAFLELTIDDLNKLLPDKLGIVKRIYRLIQAVS